MIAENVADIDKFEVSLRGKVTKALIRGAYQVQDAARHILNANVNAYKKSSRYSDTLAEGIYVGKCRNNTVNITSLGHSGKSSGTFRTRFFVGGTAERFYKTKKGKSHSTGKLDANNAISKALNQVRASIHNNFKNIK